MKNMRKHAFIISLLVMLILLLSCSGLEIQFQPKAMNKRPQKILIGAFENRILEYKPFIIKDFRDALKFEFLKLGYNAELLVFDESKIADNIACADKKMDVSDNKEFPNSRTNDFATQKEKIKLCCEKYTADMFIKGSISVIENETLVDSKASTLISVLIYNRYGEQIGEAHYTGEGRMGDAKSFKNIAGIFAGKINSKLRKLPK